MTIVASVKVHDAIVLGADSMTQLFGDTPTGQGWVKSYDHAQKLFQIGRQPVAAMVWGAGNIGPRSVASYITEFNDRPEAQKPTLQVEVVANALHTFLQKAHVDIYGSLPPEQQPGVGIMVAGYSSGTPWAEEWEFVIPGGPRALPVKPAAAMGAAWRGHPIPFARLMFGCDPRYSGDFVQLGVKPPDALPLMQKYQTQVMFDGMPIQEAVDYVSFILGTTVNYSKFELGQAICGGPLWIAIVTASDGFQWIRKHDLRIQLT